MESIKAQRIPYSQIRVVFDKARALERKGNIANSEVIISYSNSMDDLKKGRGQYQRSNGKEELRPLLKPIFVLYIMSHQLS